MLLPLLLLLLVYVPVCALVHVCQCMCSGHLGRLGQRQQVVVVFEQNHGRGGGFARDQSVRRAVDDGRIDWLGVGVAVHLSVCAWCSVCMGECECECECECE